MKIKFKKFIAIFASAAMLCTSATVLPEGMSFDFDTSITAGAEEAVTLPTTLQFGDINIIENGSVVSESGETWNYDASTNTINITADTELSHYEKCIYSDKDLNINVAEGVTLKSTVTGQYPKGAIDCTENMFIGGTGTIKAISNASVSNYYGVYAGGKMKISGVTLNVEHNNKLSNASYYAIRTKTGELIIENAVVTAPHSCQSGTQSEPCPVKILGNSVVNINSGYYGLRGSEFTFSDQAHVKIKTSRPYIIGNYDTGQLVLADEHTTDYYWRTNPDSVFKDGTTSSCAGEIEYGYYYFEYIGAKHLKYTQNNDGETHKRCCIDECINTATVTESEACSGGTATCIDKAICDYCGEEYGNPLGHSLQKTEYDPPTCTENGNKEYWYCDECNAYFSDENGINEITLNETVIPASHTLEKVAENAATCTENGNIDYWYCSKCEKYFSDENCTTEIALSDTVITANGHNYVDGKCSICGGFEDGIGRLSGVSLSLSGNIGVNFFMELSNGTVNDENAYMQFTLPNGDKTQVKVSDAEIKQENENMYYVFSCEVSAKEMDSKITAQIITSDNKGKVYEYSVKEYADSVSENPDGFDDKTLKLVNAMASYGDYAKAYFGGESLAATEEMNAVTADIFAGYEKQEQGKLPDGITYYGSSLILESNTTLRHYFKIVEGMDVSTLNFSGQKGKYHYIDIPNIAAGNLFDTPKTTVDGYTIEYSPMTYVLSVLNNDSADEVLKNTVKALYLYAKAANDYTK